MKKYFWLQLALVLFIAIAIDYFLIKAFPDWAKTNSLAIANICLTVWLIAVTRWIYIPQGEIARRQNELEIYANNHGSIDFDLTVAPGPIEGMDVVHTINVYNTGRVDITNVQFRYTSFNDTRQPGVVPESYIIPILRPGEHIPIGTVIGIQNEMFQIITSWNDPGNINRTFNKTISIP